MMMIDPKRAKALIRFWRKILGIDSEWDIVLKLNDTWQDDDQHRDAAGHITVEQGYFRAYLSLNVFNLKPDELDEVIVHELVHIVLAPLATFAQSTLTEAQEALAVNTIEATTERLARAFGRLAKIRLKKQRKAVK